MKVVSSTNAIGSEAWASGTLIKSWPPRAHHDVIGMACTPGRVVSLGTYFSPTKLPLEDAEFRKLVSLTFHPR